MSEPKNAYEEMKRVYEFYSGKSFNEPVPEKGKGRVKLIHYIQSFDPKEKYRRVLPIKSPLRR